MAVVNRSAEATAARRGAARAEGDSAPWALAPPSEPNWRLEQRGYQPALEHEWETRFALSNGAFGVRGSLEQPTVASRPRVLIAGLFDRSEREPRIPILISAADWLRLRLWLGDQPFALHRGETLAHHRTLDMQRGVLISTWRRRDRAGREVRFRTLRLVSLADRALAMQVVQMDAEQPARIALESWLEPLIDGLELVRSQPGLTVLRTRRSARTLVVATAASVRLGSRPLAPQVLGDQAQRWSWPASPGRPATFIRMVALVHGGIEEQAERQATAALARARRAGPARVLASHARAWAERWAASDIVVEGDERAQQALRFAVYHLVGAANPSEEHVSIGARALTGDAYAGHVFWDTEIFLLPFYTFTWPAAARALLMYRFHTLPAARAKAAGLGFRGALYAWESADSGEEATPPYAIGPDGQVIPIRCGTEEHHISADVAYAVWQYWEVTGDLPFLLAAGAEILLETARFWASRATEEADGLYHIRGVIGPDEYHEGVDDNAYTNGMARWNLERGLETATLLRARAPERWDELSGRLQLEGGELGHWRRVAERLVTGYRPDSGLLEQFAGYFDLEPIDLTAYALRSAPMDVLLGRERTQRSQVIKQADVVMLLALLWEQFQPAVRLANFRYYEARCAHGSSLSPAVHAMLAARLGELGLAARYFEQAARIDLDDTMGNAALGIHIGALGGLWQAAVFGFAGLSLGPDGLRFEPRLPPGWRTLRFALQWRGRHLRIEVDSDLGLLTATLERGRAMRLYVGSLAEPLRLTRGASLASRYLPLRPGGEDVAL